MDGRLHARIENISIRGFRSLADVKLEGLPPVAVLIGANGSGKSNVMRFFEMLGWMLRSSRLGDFVQKQGGADDQLFQGRRRTPQLEAELRLATELGYNDYRFVLAHAHPDRLTFWRRRTASASWRGRRPPTGGTWAADTPRRASSPPRRRPRRRNRRRPRWSSTCCAIA